MQIPILITAPEGYAQRFADALLAINDDGVRFEPVSTPLICTHASELDIAHFITAAGNYDYVVFTSRKAISVVASYLKDKGITSEAVRWPAACAIGKDNEALSLLGIPPAFIAAEPSLKGIADKLKSQTVSPRVAVLGPRVVNLTEPDTVPDFLNALHAMQAEVTFFPAYVTSPASEEALHKAEQMLNDNIEWVAFTSATEAQVYKRLRHSTTPTLACFGPYTAYCVRKEGLTVDFVSPDFSSFAAFAHHLKEHITAS